MDKGQLERSQSQPIPAERHTSLGAAAYFVACIAVFGAIWLVLRNSWIVLAWRGATLLILHALLTLILARLLAYTPLRRDWQYRAAFLISAGVALPYFGWQLHFSATPQAGQTGRSGIGRFPGWIAGSHLKMHCGGQFSAFSASAWKCTSVTRFDRRAKPEPVLKRAFDVCLAVLDWSSRRQCGW
jgi:hypothetical protein